MNKLTAYVLVTLLIMVIKNLWLKYVGESRIDVYFSLSLLIYLITTEIILPFKRKYRRTLSIIIGILIVIFMIIVARRIIEILY